jgi:DnaK suppressor protein
MAKKKRTLPTARMIELKASLERRRRELTGDVNSRIREARERSRDDHDLTDLQDGADSDAQGDVDIALIQMKADTVSRIDDALRRLAEGSYGNCATCAGEISRERLQALPFAVRCTDCEDSREQAARLAAAVRPYAFDR